MKTLTLELSDADYLKLAGVAGAKHQALSVWAADAVREKLAGVFNPPIPTPAPAPPPPTTTQPPVPRYAYKVTTDDTPEQMAALGAQGWVLVIAYLMRANVIREWLKLL